MDRKALSKIAFRPNFFEIGLFGIRLRECWNAESCDEEHHALLCLGTHSTDTACYWLPYDLFFSKILSICTHSSPVMVRYGMSFVSSKFRYCICKLFYFAVTARDVRWTVSRNNTVLFLSRDVKYTTFNQYLPVVLTSLKVPDSRFRNS